LLSFVWSIWFVWFVLFIWLNQTDQIDQMNQTNQINLSRVLRLASMKIPVLYFESSSFRLTTDTMFDGRIRGMVYA